MGSPTRILRTPKKALQATPCKLASTPRSVRSPFVEAKKVLSSSAGEELIGRNEEQTKVLNVVRDALNLKKSTVLYISGPAGTGKTLTVNTVIQNLENNYNFKLININCMSFETLSNFYEQIFHNYETSPKKQRRNATNEKQNELLIKIKDVICHHKYMTIMILDEVDQLKSKNNEVLKNIFKLPFLSNNKLILIGISNALDFTAKMNWIKELDKSSFTELKFMPYNKDQIVQIISHRLRFGGGDEENVMIEKIALDYCARKIASCSGDIRKALDVCRRAVEMVENNTRKHIVRSLDFGSPLKPQNRNINSNDNISTNHVTLQLMINTVNKVYGGVLDKLDNESKVFLPSDQQLILCTLLLLLKSKSMREVKLSDCRQYLNKICSKKNINSEGKSESDILTMCQLLADYGYLSIKNDTSLQFGRSPSKLGRTPTKKKPVVLSLRIDPSETEQLLSSFHKAIVSNGAMLIS